ncbi:MAG TPA: MerR family transcriptional regulator [Kofleriaceae bacterium]|nr:MerR family transcriptional regulator [Kofleriaceae bacterium]
MAKRRRTSASSSSGGPTGSADPRIPDKHFFRIGEVAAIAEVEAYVLRFWETEFPSLAPGKSKTGRRQYGRSDVAEVLRIRDLLYTDGFTIAGARKHLKAGGEPTEGEMSARTRGLLDRVRKEAEDILRLVEE